MGLLPEQADDGVSSHAIDWGIHGVQFYSRDEFLIQKLARTLAAALHRGESVLVVATPDHRADLTRKLQAEVPDFTNLIVTGRYVAVDAADTLSRLMVNGSPDPARFMEIIAGLATMVSRAGGRSERGLTAFGEMVALLWARGNREAAIQLEMLWNALQKERPLSLICAYRLQSFAKLKDQEDFLRICSEHTHVFPDDADD
jgi:hypothetical protein